MKYIAQIVVPTKRKCFKYQTLHDKSMKINKQKN